MATRRRGRRDRIRCRRHKIKVLDLRLHDSENQDCHKTVKFSALKTEDIYSSETLLTKYKTMNKITQRHFYPEDGGDRCLRNIHNNSCPNLEDHNYIIVLHSLIFFLL